MQSRREFLRHVATAGTVGYLGLSPRPVAAEPPPETARLRMVQIPGICIAPVYVAEQLLRAEGFTELQYVKQNAVAQLYKSLAAGDADINMAYIAPWIIQIDAGEPIVVLGGVHAGCYELFGTDRVRAIHDLKGKRVAIPALGSPHHVFLASLLAHVGLDPSKDIEWATHPPAEAMRLLHEGKVDAYLGFPPDPQELRARKVGRVVMSSAVDRPWAQYFCCFVAGNREFVRKHPVATKRAMRAILKAASICALEPERAARTLVDGGFARSYEYALQTMKDLPYDRWQTYDAEDTVRFYALRLHEAGMIKANPKKIIAQGTDWRFFNELRKELKG